VGAVAMLEQRLDRMEQMLSDLILSVGTLKAYFEEEKDENARRFRQIDRRFEQIDRRFEQIDRRFDEVMEELRGNKREHDYMASRLFRAEMELAQLKEQLADKAP
jgi:chromosome segregation ATPase